MNLPSYAPTSTTSYTPSTGNSEITRSSLIKTPAHKTTYNALAEIYSILPALEMVENAFLKDYITDKNKYTSTAYRLISQHEILMNSLKTDNTCLPILTELLGTDLQPDLSNFPTLFATKFHINCPLAAKRIEQGIPATTEILEAPESKANPRLVAEITGNFITCMDALKLNYRLKEQLHPLLSDLVINLNTLNETNEARGKAARDFPGKSRLVNWLIKLNNSSADLNREDMDAFLQDLDVAYKGFYGLLE